VFEALRRNTLRPEFLCNWISDLLMEHHESNLMVLDSPNEVETSNTILGHWESTPWGLL
jgi:hypothetical protein